MMLSVGEAQTKIGEPAIANLKEDQVTIEWTTEDPTTASVEYGFTEALGLKQESNIFSNGHRITLQNLKPKKLYYFKISVKDKKGTLSKTSLYSFKTESFESYEKNILKIISPPQVTAVSPYEVVITWETNLMSNSFILYGIKGQKPHHYFSQLDTRSHIVTLEDLTPYTRYFYQIESQDNDRQKVTSSYSFFDTQSEAKEKQKPFIESGPAVAVRQANRIKLEWTTDRPCKSMVSFGKVPFPSFQTKKNVENSFSNLHTFHIDKLSKKTRYFYTIYLEDQNGQKSTSEVYSVTTETFD